MKNLSTYYTQVLTLLQQGQMYRNILIYQPTTWMTFYNNVISTINNLSTATYNDVWFTTNHPNLATPIQYYLTMAQNGTSYSYCGEFKTQCDIISNTSNATPTQVLQGYEIFEEACNGMLALLSTVTLPNV
jgi:hypothetical protein